MTVCITSNALYDWTNVTKRINFHYLSICNLCFGDFNAVLLERIDTANIFPTGRSVTSARWTFDFTDNLG